ncbi:cytochrome c peroxidase [Hymenobacter saemangeumensis]|uniref:Cytochrome c peroxidase n=1 Tax=Hymenobacter saemangeumensis TaxID=1084522 RepID=A0ABP8IQI1_9BACT
MSSPRPARFLFWLPAALLALGVLSCCNDPNEPNPVPEPTVYRLQIPENFPQNPAQPANNPLTNEGVELGRHLFYETALSVDNSISCASCHRQDKAFADAQPRAVGVNGARHARNSMPLQNLLWEDKLTWDGASATLEQQARVPLENPIEMHLPLTAGVSRLKGMPKYVDLFRKAFRGQDITEENTLKALAQFERTLISGNSRFDRYRRGNRTLLNSDELRGLQLFVTHPDGRVRGGNCSDCHAGDLQTDREFRNNGLDATLTDLGLGAVTGRASDNGKFRVPSLRNIELTAPYMHDGRFGTLEQVLDHYNEHVARNSPNIDPLIVNATNDPFQAPSSQLGLTATEKRQIIAFLKTLTDSSFVRDPRFARP